MIAWAALCVIMLLTVAAVWEVIDGGRRRRRKAREAAFRDAGSSDYDRPPPKPVAFEVDSATPVPQQPKRRRPDPAFIPAPPAPAKPKRVRKPRAKKASA